MRRKISISRNEILLLFVAIIFCLFLMEGVLQAAHYIHRNDFYARNFEFETFDRLNSDGLRGPRVSSASTAGHPNVFVIGDSFMYGVGVSEEQSVPRRLEKNLSKNAACAISVFNLGRPGTGPTVYAQTACQYSAYQPDVAIVGLYLGNDIEAKERVQTKQPSSIMKRIRSLMSHSATIKAITSLVRSVRGNVFHECLAAGDTGVDILSFHLPKNLEEAMCDGRMNPHLLSRGAVGDNDAYFQEVTLRFTEDSTTKEKLLEIKNSFPTSRFILLVIPSKYQVNAAYLQPMRELGYMFTKDSVVDRHLQDAVLAWAKRQHIDAIDLLPLMAEQERKTGIRLFYQYDEHPNEHGSEFMADVLLKRLEGSLACKP